MSSTSQQLVNTKHSVFTVCVGCRASGEVAEFAEVVLTETDADVFECTETG